MSNEGFVKHGIVFGWQFAVAEECQIFLYLAQLKARSFLLMDSGWQLINQVLGWFTKSETRWSMTCYNVPLEGIYVDR